MFCNKCGNKIDENSGMRFCNRCGNDLTNILTKLNENNEEKIIEEVDINTQVISDEDVIKDKEVSQDIKKKRRRNLWIAIILSCSIWTIFCWIMIFCFGEMILDKIEDTDSNTTLTNDTTVSNKNTDIQDDDESNNVVENKTDTALSKEESAKKFKEEGKRIGSEEYGYISVPKNWAKFYDIDGNNTIQYSYANVWIATIYSIDADVADSLTYASGVYSSLESDGVENLKAGYVKINDYSACQVSCYYPDDNVYLVCWFIDGEDGKTHYISVEGPDASSNYFYDIVLTFGEKE